MTLLKKQNQPYKACRQQRQKVWNPPGKKDAGDNDVEDVIEDEWIQWESGEVEKEGQGDEVESDLNNDKEPGVPSGIMQLLISPADCPEEEVVGQHRDHYRDKGSWVG